MGAKSRSQETLNAFAHRHYHDWHTGDGTKTEFPMAVSVLRADDVLVFVAGLVKQSVVDYNVRGLTAPATYAGDSNRIKFVSAPGNGVKVLFYIAGG